MYLYSIIGLYVLYVCTMYCAPEDRLTILLTLIWSLHQFSSFPAFNCTLRVRVVFACSVLLCGPMKYVQYNLYFHIRYYLLYFSVVWWVQFYSDSNCMKVQLWQSSALTSCVQTATCTEWRSKSFRRYCTAWNCRLYCFFTLLRLIELYE